MSNEMSGPRPFVTSKKFPKVRFEKDDGDHVKIVVGTQSLSPEELSSVIEEARIVEDAWKRLDFTFYRET